MISLDVKKTCRCLKHFEKCCQSCGRTFKVCKYRIKSAKYCSFRCHGKATPIKERLKISCLYCKKIFTPLTPFRSRKAQYCSTKCVSRGTAKRGAESPQWKGGLTAINKRIRHTFEYEDWRKSVFERDNYTCQTCGKIGGYLNADHIKPFALYPDLRLDINNGRTLCVDCHRQTDTFAGRMRNYDNP